jgi:hypothetical protein
MHLVRNGPREVRPTTPGVYWSAFWYRPAPGDGRDLPMTRADIADFQLRRALGLAHAALAHHAQLVAT